MSSIYVYIKLQVHDPILLLTTLITVNCLCSKMTNYFHFHLIEDVLLNQSCMYSHQCLESPYAACLEGRCSCLDGYKARNNGQCEKSNVAL